MNTQSAPPAPMVVTLRQAAVLTGYSPRTLQNAILSGELACIRNGGNLRGHIRLRPAEIDRWLSSNEVTAPAANQAAL